MSRDAADILIVTLGIAMCGGIWALLIKVAQIGRWVGSFETALKEFKEDRQVMEARVRYLEETVWKRNPAL